MGRLLALALALVLPAAAGAVDLSGSVERVSDTCWAGDDLQVDVSLDAGAETLVVGLRVLLSKDATPDAEDVVMLEEEVEVASHLDATLLAFVPPDAFGSRETDYARHVLLVVDPDDVVAETDEGNNVASAPVDCDPRPDLLPAKASVELPDGCIFGKRIEASFEIENDGRKGAPLFMAAVVLSDNDVLTVRDPVVLQAPAACARDADCADSLGSSAVCDTDPGLCTRDCFADEDCVNDAGEGQGLACLKHSGATREDVGTCTNLVASGDTRTLTLSGKLPLTDAQGAPLPDGVYHLGVIVDVLDLLWERDETNNTLLAIGAVTCRHLLPDLAATGLRVPALAAAGEQLWVRRTLENRGELGASAKLRYVLSTNEMVGENDLLLPFVRPADGTPWLEAGSTDDATDVLMVPESVLAGRYFVGLRVDPENEVRELDEGNNELVSSVVEMRGAALRVVSGELADAGLGVSYLQSLVATGGAGSYGWEATSPLPPGLELSSSGQVAGRAAGTGSFLFGVRVNSGEASADALVSLRVVPPTTALTITSRVLPPAYLGKPYDGPLTAVGGYPPYEWAIIGRPPQGVWIRDGHLVGILELPGCGSFEVTVRDAHGTSTSANVTLCVYPSSDLAIATRSLLPAVVDTPYRQALRASGGQPPDVFEIAGLEGSGITVAPGDDDSVILGGAARSVGLLWLDVLVRDAAGAVFREQMPLPVLGGAIRVDSRTLAPVKQGDDYRTRLTAARDGVTWKLHAGELPPGLTLHTDGDVSGQVAFAAAPRLYSFLAHVTDERGDEGFGAFSIQVALQSRPITDRWPGPAPGCCGSSDPADAALPALGMLLLRRRRQDWDC